MFRRFPQGKMRVGCDINKDLLPVKAHFFLMTSAFTAIDPYLSLIAKQLGITATNLGFIHTIIPFLTILAKPLFGSIADKLQNAKQMITILVILLTASYLVINFLPKSQVRQDPLSLNANCTHNISIMNDLQRDEQWACLIEEMRRSGVSNIIIIICDNKTYQANITSRMEIVPLNDNASSVEECSNSSCTIVLKGTMPECQHAFSSSSSQTLWLFAVFRILCGVMVSVLWTLADSYCYENLRDKVEDFGKQRLWGTVGAGIMAVSIGQVYDYLRKGKEYNYSVGFYVMVAFMAADSIVLLRARNVIVPSSDGIARDVFKIFRHIRPLVFLVSSSVAGIFTGVLDSYQFWYLDDMGATKLIIGLSVMSECVLSEVPLFFFSGKIMRRIGHELCIVLAFLAFAIRFICYSFTYNPWLVLLFDLTQGVSFGVYTAAMTSFAKLNAPEGTGTTMQGVFGGMNSGLGVAVGSMLAGLGFDKYGGRWTFRIVGISAVMSAVVLFSTYWIMYYVNKWKSPPIENPEHQEATKQSAENKDDIELCDWTRGETEKITEL